MNQKVYQFKVSLEGIRPQIWRKIQVPENYNFYELHVAIQDSFGWEDYHLHQYMVKNPETGRNEIISMPNSHMKVVDERKAKISKYFTETKQNAHYEYDFGDSWEHNIILEKIVFRAEGEKYPKCIGGKRACPPEDCGGVWGYEALIEIIKNPKHPEYKERLEWLGGKFDPEKFDHKDLVFQDPKERLKMMFE